jgi:hypothetical protein
MERQETSGVATEHLQVTGRSLLKGTSHDVAVVMVSLPLRHDLTRRSMTDE